LNIHVAATEANSAFPTLSDDHPHALRGMVRHRATGQTYVVLGLIIWSSDHFDSCDDVIVAPIDDMSTWLTLKEYELDRA
jgi:hypothetical protein